MLLVIFHFIKPNELLVTLTFTVFYQTCKAVKYRVSEISTLSTHMYKDRGKVWKNGRGAGIVIQAYLMEKVLFIFLKKYGKKVPPFPSGLTAL